MNGANMLLISETRLEELFTNWLQETLPKLSLNNSSKEEKDEVFDLNTAAKYLNLTPGTLRVMKCKGKVPALSRGKKICFSKTALDQWNDAGRPANEDKVAFKVDELLSKTQRRGNPKNSKSHQIK